MTKTKSTKRALLMSALALLMCVSMLIGSTFAWFTDSVTSSGNKIVAGTLDIQLLMDADVDGTYDDISDSTSPIFGAGSIAQNNNAETLWEPGKTQVAYLAIKNNGNLDLKYTVGLNVQNVSKDLYEVMEYAIVPDADANNKVIAWNGGNSVVVGTQSVSGDVELKVGATHYFALAIHMDEEAGNEYQGGEVNFDLTVLATQLASEFDSFDNQYDVDADYVAEVKNANELATALRTGGLVKLANDISVTETLTVPAGVVVNLDLNGKEINGTVGRDADNNRVHTLVNNGTLNLIGGTVKSSGNDGGSAILNNAGATLTIEDVTVYGAPLSNPVYPVSAYPSYGINNYGMMTVNGATIKTYHGAIATGDNGVTVINDADIDVGQGTSTGITSYAIYSYGNAQVTVNGGKFAFTKQEVYVNGGNTFCELGNNPIMINGGNYIGTSFSTGAGREYVINGGTFDADPSAYAKGQVVHNSDGTWTVKPYEVSTAAELEDKLANGNPVVLTSNVAFTTQLSITKDAYIDGNGKTIKFTSSGSATRFIDVQAAGADLTIKNAVIDIDGSYCQRGINYNTNGTLILDNVTLTGATKATYGINLPSGSANATVEMKNCDITALIALNVWGENAVINITDCNLSNYDNNATEGENYVTVMLNNNGTDSAEGAVITFTGGTITAKDETGAPCIAIKNNTATGAIVVSDTTVVNGITATNVAVVRYKDGNGNFYNEFYGSTTLQSAVTLASQSTNAEVFLLTDITVDTLDVPANNIIVHKNGHNLTVGATTGGGTLDIRD